MTNVFCEPDDRSVPVEGSTTLLEALVSAGIPITHLCGGRARCSTCRVRIGEGLEGVADRTEAEAEMARRLDFPDEVRLACQTRVSTSVRLRRLVIDEADAAMASQIGSHGLHGPIGREVEVGVMFADVADYTAMAESLPPYDVVHTLNRFFTGTAAAVVTGGGVVDNYMGDAVLALFGVDHQADPAAAAITSGLAALEVAADLDRYMQRVYRRRFRVRVGVDHGEVVYGLLGAEGSARETAIGDAVNVASRLQAANKEVGTVMLASESAIARCARPVELGRAFELDLRGKLGRVGAHEVLGIGSAPTAARPQAGGSGV